MKRTLRFAIAVAALAIAAPLLAQTTAPASPAATKAPAAGAAKTPSTTHAAKPSASAQDENIQEYIKLLRQNVRKEKVQIMGTVMQLDPSDSAKFWPIYSAYEGELSQLEDQRIANIKQYAADYSSMTDAKADDLVRKSMDYQQQRNQLLMKYYGQVKDAIGGVNAARFLQVEHQLLLIIDLQISSNLPVVGS